MENGRLFEGLEETLAELNADDSQGYSIQIQTLWEEFTWKKELRN
ncbi:hypothetical protein [Shouchella clausii]|nr:hypothetical protein [Shouchella clausii]